MIRMTLDQARDWALGNMGAEEVEKRREAERLWLAREAAHAAYETAFRKRPREESEDDSNAHPDVAPLWQVYEAAEAAWQAADTNGDVVMPYYQDEPERCALTNLIIHDEDDVVEHPSGKRIHVAALGFDVSVLADDEPADNDDDADNDFDDDDAPSGRLDEGESDGASDEVV